MRTFSFNCRDFGEVTLRTNSDAPLHSLLERKSAEFDGRFTPADGSEEKDFTVSSPIRPVLIALGRKDFEGDYRGSSYKVGPKEIIWRNIGRVKELKEKINRIESFLEGTANYSISRFYRDKDPQILKAQVDEMKRDVRKLEEEDRQRIAGVKLVFKTKSISTRTTTPEGGSDGSISKRFVPSPIVNSVGPVLPEPKPEEKYHYPDDIPNPEEQKSIAEERKSDEKKEREKDYRAENYIKVTAKSSKKVGSKTKTVQKKEVLPVGAEVIFDIDDKPAILMVKDGDSVEYWLNQKLFERMMSQDGWFRFAEK